MNTLIKRVLITLSIIGLFTVAGFIGLLSVKVDPAPIQTAQAELTSLLDGDFQEADGRFCAPLNEKAAAEIFSAFSAWDREMDRMVSDISGVPFNSKDLSDVRMESGSILCLSEKSDATSMWNYLLTQSKSLYGWDLNVEVSFSGEADGTRHSAVRKGPLYYN